MLVVRMKNEPGVLSQCSKRLIFKPWLGRWLPRKVTFSSQSLLVCNAGVLQGTKYEDRLKVTLWKLKLTNHCWLWMDSTIFHQNLYWVPMIWIRVFGFGSDTILTILETVGFRISGSHFIHIWANIVHLRTALLSRRYWKHIRQGENKGRQRSRAWICVFFKHTSNHQHSWFFFY